MGYIKKKRKGERAIDQIVESQNEASTYTYIFTAYTDTIDEQ